MPYSVDVYFGRAPYLNVLLILLTLSAFLLQWELEEQVLKTLVLDGWTLSGLFGHAFIHGDIGHLIGNMVYLWIFGNAICAKISNFAYLLLYFFLTLAAAALHNIFDGNTAVGASGAIFGLIGFYLVLYPTNRISCFWWFILRFGTIRIAGMWLIAFWVAKDIYGFYHGEGNIAYISHLGGFATGFILALLLHGMGSIERTESDLKTFPELLFGTKQRQPAPSMPRPPM